VSLDGRWQPGRGGLAPAGVTDYRLARRALISEYRKGRLARHQVCDAHPELLRNAEFCGSPTSTVCPICGEHELTLVTYVFGSRLPASGRCITKPKEIVALQRRREPSMAYVVEVCVGCHWNHLARTFPLGTRQRRPA
jgi:Family of unknown function (DUF5318)